MRLKIPPVIVFSVFGGLMFLLAKFLPFGYFEFFGRGYLMYVLLAITGCIGFISLFKFFKSKTTIDPTSPSKTSKLITSGIYQYSRNPMYLSLLLMLIVWGLWLGNAFNVLLAAGFVAYMNAFQILPEEEMLIQLFGKEYKQYCTLVRRWF